MKQKSGRLLAEVNDAPVSGHMAETTLNAAQQTSLPRPQIDTARLKSALKVTAMLVQKLGDDYLPFFMRLETELAKHEAKEAARARVLKVLEDE